MTGVRHARLVELFNATVELPPEERSRYLEAHAKESERVEVERLLRGDRAAKGFIEEPLRPGAEMLADVVANDAPIALRVTPERIGRYVIEGLLGSGSMGLVYLARQDDTGQVVALKLLRGALAGPKGMSRFAREEKILGRLQHPGIAHILEAGVADVGAGEQPFFAMEYVEGRDLIDHARAKDLSASARVRLLAAVCDALDHAHQRGVIHRDIKPENVLATEDGQVKVLDFGVARVTDPDLQLTTLRSGEAQIIGTIAYMSPEQAAGDVKRLDKRSDIYSLGVIAYELLADRRPLDLEGRTVLEAVRIVQEVDPPPLASIQPGIPRDLEVIVHKALEKEPARRYPDAAALAADLRRWLRHEPISARPASTLYTLKKLARRHRGLTAGLVSSFLILVAGTVTSLLLANRAVRASERARWQTYLATLAAASAELQTDSIEQARDRLESAPPEHRGIEWNFLWNLADQSRWMLEGHVFNVWNVAVSPDGTRAYSCAGDGTARAWDLDTGVELRVLDDHDERVFSVAASPDGTRMASGSADQTVRLRDARTLETIAVLEGHEEGIFGLAFSSDGTLLVSGANNGTMFLWDARDGTQIRQLPGHPKRIWAIEFVPGAPLFASASEDGTVRFWDASDGSEVGRLETGEQAVFDISLSRDGSELALVTGGDELQLWDVHTRERIAAITAEGAGFASVAFAPGGGNLVTGRLDGGVDVREAGTLVLRNTLRGHSDWVRSLAFSPDGHHLVSSSWDDTVRVWDARRLDERVFPETGAGRVWVAVAPGAGTAFVGLEDGRVQLQDLLTGEVLSHVGVIEKMFMLETDAAGGVLAAGPRAAHRLGVRLLDVRTGELRVVPGSPRFALSRDGSLVASSPEGRGEVTVNDTRTGALLNGFGSELEHLSALAFDHAGDHLFVAGYEECEIRMWDVTAGRVVDTLEGHANFVLQIARNPSGTRLVSGGQDRVAIVWDALTRERLATLSGHGTSVTSVVFHPDGSRIATGAQDGTIRIWSAETFEVLALISLGPHEPRRIAFSSDGDLLIVETAEDGVFVLDGRPVDVARH